MWIVAIVAAALGVGAAAYAFWPRRTGVVDGDVSRGRRSVQGTREHTDPSLRQQFPPGI